MIDPDAYKDATGPVLLYKYDNSLHPIEYHSRKYAPAECNYGGGQERAVSNISHVCEVAMLHRWHSDYHIY